MQAASGQPAGDPVRRKHYLFQGMIVRQHRDNDLGLCSRVPRRLRDGSALFRKTVGPASGAVVNGECVAGLGQVAGHRRSHVTQADESDFHKKRWTGRTGSALLRPGSSRTWSRSAVIRWRITELERVRFVMKDGKVVRDDFAKPQKLGGQLA